MKREEPKIIDLLCDMGIDANGNRNLQPWKAYDIDEVNLVINTLEAENAWLKKEAAEYRQLQWQHDALIDENERLKRELKQMEVQDQVVREELHNENSKLRYALARLRWAHALSMETMIDELHPDRPPSWKFYHKSKVYWYGKCQELKKKLSEK